MPAAALHPVEQARGPCQPRLGEEGSGGEAALHAKGCFCVGFFLSRSFLSSLSLPSLFWPVPGALMNYPNTYSVWEENTYHIYL